MASRNQEKINYSRRRVNKLRRCSILLCRRTVRPPSHKRNSRKSTHFFCKAIVLLIVVEGLGCGAGSSALLLEPNETLPYAGSYWRASQNENSSFGNNDADGGNSFASTFGGNLIHAARKMRERCGRYSLLKVLQQWENMQRRCRSRVRNVLNTRTSSNATQYYDEATDPMEYISNLYGSPSEANSFDEYEMIPSPTKRSRYPFFHTMSLPTVNNQDGDSEMINYYYDVNGDALESCCPVVFEVIAPVYGRNRSGHMVELYKDEHVQQKFNEYRCRREVAGKSCRFMDNQVSKISRCVQQYLDTYALVKSDKSATGWSMEHIRVASGCACKVDPAAARRRKKVLSDAEQQHQLQQRNRWRNLNRLSELDKWYNFGRTINKRNSKRRPPQNLARSPSTVSDY